MHIQISKFGNDLMISHRIGQSQKLVGPQIEQVLEFENIRKLSHCVLGAFASRFPCIEITTVFVSYHEMLGSKRSSHQARPLSTQGRGVGARVAACQ
jgi:hypothetical protein